MGVERSRRGAVGRRRGARTVCVAAHPPRPAATYRAWVPRRAARPMPRPAAACSNCTCGRRTSRPPSTGPPRTHRPMARQAALAGPRRRRLLRRRRV
eukprot:3620838-Prymnesium_polylepis.1